MFGFAKNNDGGEIDSTLLSIPQETRTIGEKEIARAHTILRKYKDGKSVLENTIVENEQWYRLRHWDKIRSTAQGASSRPEPTSAWLFNSLANKHADAMDNYPEPNVLPRELGDAEDAKTLASVIPCIIERNQFEDTYSDVWHYKLKHGTGVYGVFWDNNAENGLGDISIKKLDLLNLFWEPGISNIQDSRNLFIVNLQDNDMLESQYPQLKNTLAAGTIDIKKYQYDDQIDTSEKSAVIDWYYKVRAANGKTLLHYVKFVGNEILFASENEEQYTEKGFYDHGQYPVVFDVLFPQEGSPAGFGYINVCRDPQTYIDKLSQGILENTMIAVRPRYFIKKQAEINEEQFLDINRPLVEVETSNLNDDNIRRIEPPTLPANALNVLQMKIDELKETSSNRDFSTGGAGSGVTAAAAISALQEAGNKTSRDMISASYRKFTQLTYLCIELIRQFYDESRSFRITGESAQPQFVEYNNRNLKAQPLPNAFAGEEQAFRMPVFDIQIRAQKRSPYSRMAQNELAKELYGAAFFDPMRAEQSLSALELMDFEGKEKIKQRIQEGQTMMNQMQQMQEQMQKMAMIIEATTGQSLGDAPQSQSTSPQKGGGHAPIAQGIENAQTTNMTSYGDKLAARATPNMTNQRGVQS